jgi:3'(2'), 5'-bisphosphate nucleotidase
MVVVSQEEEQALCRLAQSAGRLIMAYRQAHPQLDVKKKADATPVTEADQQASDYLVQALEQQWPDVPIISEEATCPPYKVRTSWSHYWLIDPLDGTRGFIQGSDEFTVNVALIENGLPVWGVMVAPVWGVTWVGRRNAGAYRIAADGVRTVLQADEVCWDGLRVLTGRFHGKTRLQALFDLLPSYRIHQQNSSLKFARIAEGKADFYPRFGPIYEWDIAAGQAILQAAGGRVVDVQGHELQYNTKSSMLAPPFMALGRMDAAPAQQLWQRLLDQLGALL